MQKIKWITVLVVWLAGGNLLAQAGQHQVGGTKDAAHLDAQQEKRALQSLLKLAEKLIENTPIACYLTTTELRDREATVLAEFRSGVIETEELQEGYAFRLPGDGKCIGLIAELIVAERECCPFLTIELVAQPSMGPVIVRVTGPTGTKNFLKTVLCKPEAAV